MNILFVTSNRVGDAVLSTGVLETLLARYPDARVTIACGPYASDLFRAVPRLDRLIVLRKKTWNRHWLGLWRECVGTRWDLIADLRNSLITRLLPANIRLYTAPKSGKHIVVENVTLLTNLDKSTALKPSPSRGGLGGGRADIQTLGLRDAPPSNSPRIHLDQISEQAADTILPPGPVLALGPAANWPCKQWPVEYFAELAKKITAPDGLLPGASILVLADGLERDQVEYLLQSIPDNRRIELIGQHLLTVASCLKRARLYVGNDSGLMHMAAALGTPTLGLFGPGWENIYGPWGTRTAWVRTPESRDELLARLPHPKAREPNLMQTLQVETVIAAAKALLERTAG